MSPGPRSSEVDLVLIVTDYVVDNGKKVTENRVVFRGIGSALEGRDVGAIRILGRGIVFKRGSKKGAFCVFTKKWNDPCLCGRHVCHAAMPCAIVLTASLWRARQAFTVGYQGACMKPFSSFGDRCLRQ